MKRRAWIAYGLILCATLVAIGLLIFLSRPTSLNIVDQRLDAHIEFTLDRNQVLLPTDCVWASWHVDGIREVYFNRDGVVGESEREVCPWNGIPSLRVIFQDGTEAVYTLPVRVLTYNLIFLVALLGIAFLLLAGVWLLHAPLLINICMKLQHFFRRLVISWLSLLRYPLLVVGGLTLIATAFRLGHITDFSLVLDEAAIWQIARGFWSDVLLQNATANSAPPLFAFVLNSWSHVGALEFWLRLLPAFASVLTIPTIFVLGSRLLNRNAGYFCATVFTLAASQISFAQYLREYSLAILLTILILTTYWNYLKCPTRNNIILIVMVWSISIATNYGLWLVIAGLNIAYLIEWVLKPNKRRLAIWLGSQAMVGLVAVVMVMVALRFQFGGGSAESWYAIFYWDGVPASLTNYVAQGFVSLIESSLGGTLSLSTFGIFAGIGTAVLFFEPFRRPVIMMCVLPIGLALIGGLANIFPYLGIRQMIIFTPIPVLVAGIGFGYLCTLKGHRALHFFTGGILIVGLAGSLAGLDAYYRRIPYEHTRPVIETLKSSLQADDEIFVIPYAFPALDYYFLAESPERMSQVFQSTGNEAVDYMADLDDVLGDSGRTWVFVNCCQDSLETYLSARGLSSVPFAQNRDVSLYLIVVP